MILLLLFQVENVDVHFRVDESLYLQIDKSIVDFGMIDPIQKEQERPGAVVLHIFANTDWELICSPADDFLSGEGDVIPIERLKLRVSGGDYIPLTKDGVALLRGGATGSEGREVVIDLFLRLTWEDRAGDYSTRLTFTLVNVE